jgi:hypothetical protein
MNSIGSRIYTTDFVVVDKQFDVPACTVALELAEVNDKRRGVVASRLGFSFVEALTQRFRRDTPAEHRYYDQYN